MADYVTYTCKKCGCAFVDLDEFNEVFDTPLTTKYCPNCVKNGYKNKKLSQKERYIKLFEMFIRDNKIELNDDIKILKKHYFKIIKDYQDVDRKIIPSNIFNECLEILSYYKEEREDNNV